MPVKAHKLGPGVLTVGESGTAANLAVQLREATIATKVDESDPIPVLSGDEIEGDETETYELAGSLFQDYDKDSLLVWAHVNANRVLPFIFRPDEDKALEVRGFLKVRRLKIGGKVKERNESDFTWPGRQGMYQLYDASQEPAVLIAAWTDDPANDTPPDQPGEWY